jgi:hypothetical protein
MTSRQSTGSFIAGVIMAICTPVFFTSGSDISPAMGVLGITFSAICFIDGITVLINRKRQIKDFIRKYGTANSIVVWYYRLVGRRFVNYGYALMDNGLSSLFAPVYLLKYLDDNKVLQMDLSAVKEITQVTRNKNYILLTLISRQDIKHQIKLRKISNSNGTLDKAAEFIRIFSTRLTARQNEIKEAKEYGEKIAALLGENNKNINDPNSLLKIYKLVSEHCGDKVRVDRLPLFSEILMDEEEVIRMGEKAFREFYSQIKLPRGLAEFSRKWNSKTKESKIFRERRYPTKDNKLVGLYIMKVYPFDEILERNIEFIANNGIRAEYRNMVVFAYDESGHCLYILNYAESKTNPTVCHLDDECGGCSLAANTFTEFVKNLKTSEEAELLDFDE